MLTHQIDLYVERGKPGRVHFERDVPGSGRSPQWLSRLVAGALVAKGRGEPSPDIADQRVL